MPVSFGKWRRGRDSNPRYSCPYVAFRVRCFRPLSHLSAEAKPKPKGPGASRGRRLAKQGALCKRVLAILPTRTRFRFMSTSHHNSFGTDAPPVSHARFGIGDIVRHRVFPFRGVIFDVDPVFANSEEWYDSIPEDIRPSKDQPFYHLLAENGDSSYVAYVSQQNLLEDGEGGPIDHPSLTELFDNFDKGRYRLRRSMTH